MTIDRANELMTELKNEFKAYLNTDKRIQSAREDRHEAMICEDSEEIERTESFINGLIEKQNSQVEAVCQAYGIEFNDFIGLVNEYEYKN